MIKPNLLKLSNDEIETEPLIDRENSVSDYSSDTLSNVDWCKDELVINDDQYLQSMFHDVKPEITVNFGLDEKNVDLHDCG